MQFDVIAKVKIFLIPLSGRFLNPKIQVSFLEEKYS